MMAFFDEGALRLTWRNRDDTVFGVDPSAPALAGRLLGNGVFGLGWNAAFFPPGAHTGGAAVLGGEWLGLFVTPSYESTDDHGSAQGGGRCRTSGCAARRSKAPPIVPSRTGCLMRSARTSSARPAERRCPAGSSLVSLSPRGRGSG